MPIIKRVLSVVAFVGILSMVVVGNANEYSPDIGIELQDIPYLTSRMSDNGRVVATVSTEPLQYYDLSGNLVQVDTTIKIGRGQKPLEANGLGFRVSFSEHSGDMDVNASQSKVSISPISLIGDRPGVADGSQLTYEEIWPSTDLIYEVRGNGIKEQIKLKDRTAPFRFSFRIYSLDLEPILGDDGSIAFNDPVGNPVLVMPPPFAFDSSPDPKLGSVFFQLEPDGPDYLLHVILDADWMQQASISYPITIDPTVLTANSGYGGSKNYYFDILFPQSFSYTYSVQGHGSWFTTDCGIFQIFDPNGTRQVNQQTCGNTGRSGSGVITASEDQVGTWRLFVRGTNGYSKASGSVTYEILQAPQNPGTGLSSSTFIDWNWDDLNLNENGYRVYEAGSDTVVGSVAANVTTFREDNLLPGTRYVREIAGIQNQGASVYVGARSKPVEQWLLPFRAYQFDTEAAWSLGSFSSGVQVESGALKLKSTYTSGTWVIVIDSTGSQGSHWWLDDTKHETPPNTSVVYQYATSSDGQLWSPWYSHPSNAPKNRYLKIQIDLTGAIAGNSPSVQRLVVRSSTDFSPPPPPSPPNPTQSISNNPRPTWLWNPVSDPSGIGMYQIQVTDESGIVVTPTTWVDVVGEVAWTHPTPLNPGVYYAKIRAIDLAGNIGAHSAPGTVTILPETDPPIALPPYPEPNGPTEKRMITWKWSPAQDVSPITEYFIRIGTTTGGSDIVPETSTGVERKFAVRFPGPGTYYAQVRAIDYYGNEGGWSTSGEIVISPDSAAPTTPGKPSTESFRTSDTTPIWSWAPSTDASGVKSYTITIGTSVGGSDVLEATFNIADDQPPSIRWAEYDSPLQPNRYYYARVRASDWEGRVSQWSADGQVYIMQPSFLSEVANTLSAAVAPSATYSLEQNSPVAVAVNSTREAIHPTTGTLTFAQSDFVLPGKGGFDLVIDRLFMSNQAYSTRMAAVVDDPSGSGNERLRSTTRSRSHLDEVWGLGVGWSFGFPSIEEVKEGTKTARYLHLGDGRVFRIRDSLSSGSNLEGYLLLDLRFEANTGYTSTSGIPSTHALRSKDGLKYYFGNVSGQPRLIGIVNRYGDVIDFTYVTIQGEPMVSEIKDTANRIVKFAYMSGTRHLTSISYNGRVVEYVQSPTSVIGKYRLDKVIYASGTSEAQTFRFNYDELTTRFSFTSKAFSDHALSTLLQLNRATLPSGGWIEYLYEKATKHLGADGVMEYYKVSRRADAIMDELGDVSKSNDRLFSYSSNQPDGWPNSGPGPLPSNYSYWTEITNSIGTRKKLTYNWRHQMIKQETVNDLPEYRYKQVQEFSYHPDYELPIKHVVTEFDEEFTAGSPEYVYSGFDRFGNLLATSNSQGGLTATAYESAFQRPIREYTRQADDVYLYTEQTVDASNGNITNQQDSLLDLLGSNTINRSGGGSPSLDYSRQTWRWVSPGIVSSKITVNTFWVATAGAKWIEYRISYRKLGTDSWIQAGHYGPYQGALFVAHTGNNTTTINIPSPGVYEIKADVLYFTGFSNFNVTGITYDEKRTVLEGPITTDFTYAPAPNAVNLLASTLTERNGTTRITHYEYAGSAVNGGLPGEQYEGIYLSRSYTPTVFEGESQTVETKYRYSPFGEVTAILDARGNRIERSYDQLGRIIKRSWFDQSNSSLGEELIEYDNQTHREVRITEANNTQLIPRQSRMIYDPLGRFTKSERLTRSAAWALISAVNYDALGNKQGERDGNGSLTTYTYDAINRLKTVTYPDEKVAQITYNNRLRTQVHEDTEGNRVEHHFDAFGRLTKVVEWPDPTNSPLERVETIYGYDLVGNMTSTTIDGESTEYVYGNLNRLKQITFPGASLAPITYSYWHGGELYEIGDAWTGWNIRMTIDEAGRLRKKESRSGSYAGYHYDQDSNLISASTYTALGVELNRVERAYDGRSRMLYETLTLDPGTPSQMTHNMEFTYGDRVNVTAMKQPDGTWVHYNYDEWNRPISAYGPDDYLGSANTQGVWFDRSGNLTQIRFNDLTGTTVSYTPDVRNRIRVIESPLLTIRYTYDGEGNVTNIDDDIFEYDGLYRLTGFTIDGTLTTYGYDARGNRVKENGNQQWAYDSANVLTHIGGRGVSHDPSGNMTTKPIDTSGAWNMTYDAENRLIELKEDGVTKLNNEYDALGRRIRKFEDGRETVIMYKGVHVIYEWEADQGTRANPTNTWYLMIGNRRVAQIVDGVRQYLTTDHLGSVRVITDANGQVVQRFDYKPFGEDLGGSSTVTGTKYTGKPQDGTGLYYYGARFYDPSLGRFITLDPGRDGNNWYVYVRNNPQRYVDPDGLVIVPVIAIWAMSVVSDPGTMIDIQLAAEAYSRGDTVGAALDVGSALIPGATGIGRPVRQIGSKVVDGVSIGVSWIRRQSSTVGNWVGGLFGGGKRSVQGTSNLGVFGPLNRGPLPDAVANTFRSGTYTASVTQEATTLYRVYGGEAGQLGAYWTRTPPQGPLQSILDSALDRRWGNTATEVVSMRVPAGTTIYEGFAAPQGGLLGGGNQVYIPWVDPSWIIK